MVLYRYLVAKGKVYFVIFEVRAFKSSQYWYFMPLVIWDTIVKNNLLG
jgi:hypothetical protein